MVRWRASARLATVAAALAAGLAALGTIAAGPLLAQAPDPADPRAADAEAGFIERIAAERAGRGLAALAVAADLTEVARRHAARMATEGRLYHNPNLATEVSGYRVVGENVGNGGSVPAVHDAFMASATHRRQILRPGYREVGVGVVWAGDIMWVTEVFREPLAAPGPAPPVPPSPPARPQPQARPAPVPPPLTPPTPAPTLPPPPPVPPEVPAIATERLSPPLAPAVAGSEVAATAAPSPPVPDRLPAPAAAAAALLVATVALQHATVRRLGLVATRPRPAPRA